MFTRQRLVDSIGIDVRDMAPLTLLDAPKGYGKSALLSQWLNQVNKNETSIHTLEVARPQSAGNLWQQVLEAVGAPRGEPSSELRALATWVSNLTKPTVLVIDNYEQVTDDATDSSFSHLLTLNENFFLVASGRYFTLLSGPLTRAELVTKVLDRDALAFTDAEIEQALAGADDAGSDGADEERGDGAGEERGDGAGDARGEGPDEVGSAGGKEVGDDGGGGARGEGAAPNAHTAPYLRWPWALAKLHSGAAEVREGGPADTGRTQADGAREAGEDPADTAEGRMTALADSIFAGIPNVYAQRILYAVSQTGGAAQSALVHNMGLDAMELLDASQDLRCRGLICRDPRPSGVWFTLPPEMRDVLRHHHVAPHADCGFARFMVDHADLIAGDNPAEAMRIYLQFKELGRAEASVVDHFDSYVQRVKEIGDLLGVFTLESLLEHPVLLGVRLVQNRLNPLVPLSSMDETAQQILVAAAQNEENQRSGHSIIIETLLVAAERIQGKWTKALERSRNLETSLSGYADHGFQQTSTGLPMIFAVVALTGILAGDLTLARRAATRALEVSKEQGNAVEEVRAHNQLALIHSLQMEVPQSEEHLAQAAEMELLLNIEAPDASWVNHELAKGLNAVRTRDHDRATTALSTLLPGSPRMEQWPLVLLLQSHLLRNTKGAEVALTTLQQALIQHPQLKQVSPHLRVTLQARLATLAVYAGHFSAAEAILGQAEIDAPPIAAAWGRLRLFQRDFAEAHRLFQEVRDQVPTDDIDADMVLVGALGAYGAGSKKEGAQLLQWAGQLLVESSAEGKLRALPYNVLRDAATYAKKQQVVDIFPLVDAVPSDQRVYAAEPLSATEEATLQRLQAGFTLAQIATDMGVSQNTVKFHRTNIYRKMGVSTKEEALRKGAQMGLLR